MKPVILLAFANDRQSIHRYLRNLAEERRRIEAELKKAEQANLCELIVKPNTTVPELLDTIQEYSDRLAIFHFGGHAEGSELFLESIEGNPDSALAAGLAELLGQLPELQFVFLNGCSTQPQVDGLLKAGVPAVVATSKSISDKTATALSIRFYKAIAQGASIAPAFSQSVAAVKTESTQVFRIARDSNEEIRGEREERGQFISKRPGTIERWPWELYINKGKEVVREWNLPGASDNPLYGLPEPLLIKEELPLKPYRNLEWFTSSEAALFFGRGREIRDLYNRITAKDGAPLILFYGASGVGKSSLLYAGLEPRLNRTHEVLYLRRDQQLTLVGTIKAHLIEHAKPVQPAANLEVDGKPLLTYIDELQASLKANRNNQARERLNHIQQALNELKHALHTESSASSIIEAWHLREAQTQKPLVIFLDQVEEAFTRQSPEEADEEINTLLTEIQKVFKTSDRSPQGKLVLSFRKEWSPDLIARCEKKGLFFARVFLKRLEKKGTIEAIRGVVDKPSLQTHYGLSIDHALANEIADILHADPDSPLAPTLQVLLTKMWDTAPTRDGGTKRHFSQKLFHDLKSQGILLKDFLHEQFITLQKRNPDAVQSGLALDVLYYHSTDLGTSQFRTPNDVSNAYAHQEDRVKTLMQELDQLSLIVRKGNNTSLAHDTLAPLVRQQYDISDRPGQRASRILRNKANSWKNDSIGDDLDDEDLSIVESGQSGMRTWIKTEERLIEASREARKKRQARARGIKRAIISLSVIGAVFLIYSGVSSYFVFLNMKTANLNSNRFTSRILSTLAREAVTPDQAALFSVQAAHVDRNPQSLAALFDVTSNYAYLEATLKGHRTPTNSVAFSPDGNILASTSGIKDSVAKTCQQSPATDYTVHLWDLSTNQPIDSLRLIGHEAQINSITFSPDGRHLVTTSCDSTTRIWDWKTAKSLHTLFDSTIVWDAAIDPSSETVATASWNGAVRIWDLDTGDSLTTLQSPSSRLFSLDFSPSGDSIAAGSSTGAIFLWDINSGVLLDTMAHKVSTVTGINSTVYNLDFNPQGTKLAAAYGSFPQREVRVWDVKSGAQRILNGHTAEVYSVAFSPDGTILASASEDNSILLWDQDSFKPITQLKGHVAGVYDITFSRDGKRLASASHDSTLHLWSLSPLNVAHTLSGHEDGMNTLAISPDGTMLATGGDDDTIHLWSMDKGELLRVLNGHTDAVFALAFNPSQTMLASGSEDDTIQLWDPSTGEVLDTLSGHTDSINYLQFSPDGKYLASASADNTIILWDPFTGKQLDILIGHQDDVNSVVYSPDGSLLASSSYDYTIKLWNTRSGENRVTFTGHKDDIRRVAFSPDGSILASVSDDKTTRFWDVYTESSLSTMKGHTDGIYGLAFSPDGSMLATASVDSTVRLWNIITGFQIAQLTGHEWLVSEVAFNPEGTHLASTSWDGTTRIWNIHPDTLIGQLCPVSGGNMARQRWIQIMGDRPYECTCPQFPPGPGITPKDHPQNCSYSWDKKTSTWLKE